MWECMGASARACVCVRTLNGRMPFSFATFAEHLTVLKRAIWFVPNVNNIAFPLHRGFNGGVEWFLCWLDGVTDKRRCIDIRQPSFWIPLYSSGSFWVLAPFKYTLLTNWWGDRVLRRSNARLSAQETQMHRYLNSIETQTFVKIPFRFFFF